MRTFPEFFDWATKDTNLSCERTTTISPGIFSMFSGTLCWVLPFNTALLRYFKSSAGIVACLSITEPMQNDVPSSENVLFQNSIASYTASSLGSSSLDRMTTLGTIFHDPLCVMLVFSGDWWNAAHDEVAVANMETMRSNFLSFKIILIKSFVAKRLLS